MFNFLGAVNLSSSQETFMIFTASQFLCLSLLILLIWHFIPLTNSLIVLCYPQGK